MSSVLSQVQNQLDDARKRIKELEEMLKPAADTNYRLIQQLEESEKRNHEMCRLIGAIYQHTGSVPGGKELDSAMLIRQAVTQLRSAIGIMVPSCLRVLLKLLPAENEVDRQMTETVLKRVETAMTATERYCAVQETVVVENASLQVVQK